MIYIYISMLYIITSKATCEGLCLHQGRRAAGGHVGAVLRPLLLLQGHGQLLLADVMGILLRVFIMIARGIRE